MTTIEHLDPRDDRQFDQFYAAYRQAHDDRWDRPYAATELRVQMCDTGGYAEHVALVARDDRGNAVGIGSAEFPLKDNQNLGFFVLRVVPAHRQMGHGTALLEALFELGRGASRTTLMAEARWDLDADESAGTLFAKACGFTLDLVDAHRVLDLPADLPAAPVRDNYALHSWRGPCPNEWIDQYAELLGLIAQEAPGGELKLEKEFFDAGRVRFQEAMLAKQGRLMQVSVAVAPSGTLAGHTQLVFSTADSDNAVQWDTLVLAPHRGHGLGLSLKVEAMERSVDLLAGRKYVHTYNAASNKPMIDVNEAMGYRHVANLGEFIRTI